MKRGHEVDLSEFDADVSLQDLIGAGQAGVSLLTGPTRIYVWLGDGQIGIQQRLEELARDEVDSLVKALLPGDVRELARTFRRIAEYAERAIPEAERAYKLRWGNKK